MPSKTRLTADEMANAIRNGSTEYTATNLQAARALEEFEQLTAEARSDRELKEIAATRAREISDLRADIEAVADDSTAQMEQMAAATTALGALLESARARAARIAELGQRARDLGVEEIRNGATDGTDIGWRRGDDRQINQLRVGDRVLRAVDPAVLITKVATEFQDANRLNARKLPHQTAAELIAAQDEVLVPAAQVRVLLSQPFAGAAPGSVVSVDSGTAAWLCSRFGAQRVV